MSNLIGETYRQTLGAARLDDFPLVASARLGSARLSAVVCVAASHLTVARAFACFSYWCQHAADEEEPSRMACFRRMAAYRST